MARPSNDPRDFFGPTELALAAGITIRNVQFLRDNGLMPDGNGVPALKRAAFIGGLLSAGLSLIEAGRAAQALSFEPRSADGEFRSGLEFVARKLPSDFTSADVEPNDYWCHRWINEAAEQGVVTYKRHSALKGDLIIEIVDRSRVYMGHVGFSEFELIGEVSDWGTPGMTCKAWFDLPEPTEASEAEAKEYRENALGLSRTNVSLAIRTALDAITDHRKERLARTQSKTTT